MSKRAKVWYKRKWLPLVLSILAIISAPFSEEIRETALKIVDFKPDDLFFEFIFAGVLLLFITNLAVKYDRIARSYENLEEKQNSELADHRNKIIADLASQREQIEADLSTLIDKKLNPILDSINTLESRVSALNSRIDAVDSRISALKDLISHLNSKN